MSISSKSVDAKKKVLYGGAMSLNMLMRTKILCLLPLLLLVGCKTALNVPSQDEALTKSIIGSWVNPPVNEQSLYLESTYRADGTGEELFWAKDQSRTNAIQVQTLWTIKNGLLSVYYLRSSDPKSMPEGKGIKDKIFSMSKNKFTYEPYEGYLPSTRKILIKLRK
jgi:hypothetical protein